MLSKIKKKRSCADISIMADASTQMLNADLVIQKFADNSNNLDQPKITRKAVMTIAIISIPMPVGIPSKTNRARIKNVNSFI